MIATTIFLIQEKKKEWIPPLWLSVGLALVVSYALKHIIARPRPTPEIFSQIFTSVNYSFPSMHAMVVFSVLPILDREFTRVKIVWLAFAILVAFSRLYFEYHYFSDVIFGAFIGFSIGFGVMYLEEKYKPFKFLQ